MHYHTNFSFTDDFTRAWALGFVKAKQEEGALFIDVPINNLATPYLQALDEMAKEDTQSMVLEAHSQQQAMQKHIAILEETIEKLRRNIDGKREAALGNLLGHELESQTTK